MERGLSVVVPAHDEAQMIGATVQALLDQDCDLDLEIVVVANGCHDATAEVVRALQPRAEARGRRLEVLETAQANKIHAINLGDRARRHDIVMYLDADVVLAPNAISEVHTALTATSAPRLAAPARVLAPARSRVTRAYGRMWEQLPFIVRNGAGIGCYAVNASGRRRWGAYPQIIADDHFARLQFTPDERVLVPAASYTWALPEGFRELVRVRTRWSYGNDELRRRYPQIWQRSTGRHEGIATFLLGHPRLWGDAAVFLTVYLAAWGRMRAKQLSGRRGWERAVRARVVHERAAPEATRSDVCRSDLHDPSSSRLTSPRP